MKVMCNVIHEYDAKLPFALDIMAMQIANANAEAIQDDDEGGDPNAYSVGGVSCTVTSTSSSLPVGGMRG